MVMRAEPMIKVIEQVLKKVKDKKKVKIIHFSPSAKKFETTYAKNLVKKKCTDIIFICGRYEGIDARVKKIFKGDEISVGDYVLTGGELPAMVCIDAIARQIKGVLNSSDSLEENRTASHEIYARPEVYEYNGKKYRVPKVLLSGNHKLIDGWREKRSS
jgi:tRNA (guanine37-N1)-methyltransferase